ncbi:hypothetical protein SVIOM342S_01658 [Streptomyces violaceorubidus]
MVRAPTATVRVRSCATVSSSDSARLPSGSSGPGRGRRKQALSASNAARSSSWVQRRNEVPSAGSSSGVPEVNCRHAVARSSISTRQDTPSITTWWTTTASCRASRRHTARSIAPPVGSSSPVARARHSSSGRPLSRQRASAGTGSASGMSKLQRSPRTSLARSMGCRRTTAARIASRASPVRSAGVLSTTDWTKPSIASVVSPSHCTTGDPTTVPVATSRWSTAVVSSRLATAASAPSVLWVKICRAVTWSPASRSALSSEMARMLSPPSRKKSWSTPTWSSWSRAATAPHTVRSSSVPGGTREAVVITGSGSAFRSSLPFAVSGNSLITTTWAGTMYSTMCSPAHALTSSARRSSYPVAGMTYPTR